MKIYDLVISIHAPREGSDPEMVAGSRNRVISIHAPREGSDGFHRGVQRLVILISIHAPREGSDDHGKQPDVSAMISIHAPREGSDGCAGGDIIANRHFYPRSP